MYDIAIIGRGPAGISAAINASARNKNIIIFGKDSHKVLSSPAIYNYPGIPDITGKALYEKLYVHLTATNTVLSDKHVTAVYSMGNSFTIQAENEMIEAKTVILAVGVDFKKSIEGEDTFLGMGVSYCATCDAPLYRNKEVGVIGYNIESVQEANFLSEICSKVYYVPAAGEHKNLNDNIEVIEDTPLKFDGPGQAKRLVLKNNTIEADGFFVIKDSYPLGALVPGLEVSGPHVVVNKQMETNIKGLYAAGDVTGKPYQISRAMGEGQVAVFSAIELMGRL